MTRVAGCAWLCVAFAALSIACDGKSAPASPPVRRQPASTGQARAACSAWLSCPPGSGCVFADADHGHCVATGSPGGPCRTGELPPCDAGLACAGKGGTCIPLAPAGAACAAASCEEPAHCGDAGERGPVCAVPGERGGRCRAMSPACESGLGCVSGSLVCAPTRPDGTCSDGRNFFGCADGRVCPRWPGDASSMSAVCGVPGVSGGPCGDPALGRPACMGGLVCSGGVCRSDAVPAGGACDNTPGHPPCADDSTCTGGICISLGTETAPCRAAPAPPCEQGLACRDDVCRKALPTGASCDPSNLMILGCLRGDACVPTAGGHACLTDGSVGGRCRSISPAMSPACDDDLVCGRARDMTSVCRVPLPAGSACSPAREPFEPCARGHACSIASRTCTAEGELGSLCRGDGFCRDSLACVFDGTARRCYPAPPEVAVGQPCDMNADAHRRTNGCPFASVCLMGLCTPNGADGAPCRPVGSQPRCDDGLACLADTCRHGLPSGGPCLPGGDGDCAAPLACVAQASGAGVCQAVAGYVLQMEAAPRDLDACRDGAAVMVASGKQQGVSARDDGSARIKLPFPFIFWGRHVEEIWVGVDGVAGFPTAGTIFDPGRGGVGTLPAARTPALLAPFWDDLVLGAAPGSAICHHTFGAQGLRRFVITWRALQRFGLPDVSLSFSIVLVEGSNQIQFSYLDLFAPPGRDSWASGINAAVGLQAPGGFASVVHDGPVDVNRTWTFSPR